MPYEPEKIAEILDRLNPGEVLRQAPLGPLTSYKIGGPADFLVYPESESALGDMVQALAETGLKPFILGNGSNVLVSDQGYRGIVVNIGGMRHELELAGDILKAGGGAAIWELTPFAVKNGISGFEALSGIPGAIGGALTMNAGAFDGNISDHLVRIELMDAGGALMSWPRDMVTFGYRSAPQLRDKIILGAEFSASQRKKPEDIKARVDEILKQRAAKQPLEFPSCGSVFKRPEGTFAGKLIQDAGLKGFRIGDAQISEKHANFIVNLGKATAADVMRVINEAKKRVFENSGIMLETEVRFIGDFSYVEGLKGDRT